MAIQLVGVEGSLSLCEVEVFSNDEFSSERCASPGLNADTVLATFSRNCYEFHITRGDTFEKARQVCQSHGKYFIYSAIPNQFITLQFKWILGGDLMHSFKGPTQDFILSELDRWKGDLRTQLVWIGAQKEPGLTNRIWKWVNGKGALQFKFPRMVIETRVNCHNLY